MDTKIHNKPNGCLWEKRMRAKNVDKKEGKEEERKKGRWMACSVPLAVQSDS